MPRVEPKSNKNLIICPRSKQFTDLVVCSVNCQYHCNCEEYKSKITIEQLESFIKNHPEYEIKGELMATKKQSVEKKFWIINKDKTITEVEEKEIINNPQEYVDKEIWERPPYKYELVISLKRVRA